MMLRFQSIVPSIAHYANRPSHYQLHIGSGTKECYWKFKKKEKKRKEKGSIDKKGTQVIIIVDHKILAEACILSFTIRQCHAIQINLTHC